MTHSVEDVVLGDVVLGDVVPGDVVPGDVVLGEVAVASSIESVVSALAEPVPAPVSSRGMTGPQANIGAHAPTSATERPRFQRDGSTRGALPCPADEPTMPHPMPLP
jgi:hypothetical protein